MKIDVASSHREWMDGTPLKFANRCLPLLIANQYGWILRNPYYISIYWNGGNEIQDISITSEDPDEIVMSHFGSGIVTWTIPYVFRTPPGYNLQVRGPSNSPKDGIYPLEGIVESDWLPFSFTMNWKVTRKNTVISFAIGEPIAMIVPLCRGDIESFEPSIHDIRENSELNSEYWEWTESRNAFNEELQVPNSDAAQTGWQKNYFQGKTLNRTKVPKHQTQMHLGAFIERTHHE